jgi:hypothetical protein
MAHFAHWMSMCGLPAHMLDEGCIDQFLYYLLPRCDCLEGAQRSPSELQAALMPMLETLGAEGVIALRASRAPSWRSNRWGGRRGRLASSSLINPADARTAGLPNNAGNSRTNGCQPGAARRHIAGGRRGGCLSRLFLRLRRIPLGSMAGVQRAGLLVSCTIFQPVQTPRTTAASHCRTKVRAGPNERSAQADRRTAEEVATNAGQRLRACCSASTTRVRACGRGAARSKRWRRH